MSFTTAFHQSSEIKIPTGPEWPPQGKWAYEDYCRLPEDNLIYEVLEGELYVSRAPQTIHQRCSGELLVAFLNFEKKYDAGQVYQIRIDLILPSLATPAQPDVLFIVKDRLDIVKEDRIEGAPDIIAEVLSPWNWHVDRYKKFTVYAKAGVREYWIVDPKARTIELFFLRGGAYELIGKYGVGETVRSEVLSGFEVKVEEVCPT